MEAVQLDSKQNPTVFERAYLSRQDGNGSASAPTDWDQVFENYDAVASWPAVSFWPELLYRYPGARCILTTRDPEKWWNSVAKTLQSLEETEYSEWSTKMEATQKMWEVLVRDGDLKASGLLKDEAIRLYSEHVDAVMSHVARRRLHVVDSDRLHDRKTWEELCQFLDGGTVRGGTWPQTNEAEDSKGHYSRIEEVLERA